MRDDQKSGAYYYWVVGALQKMMQPEDQVPYADLDEIDQIRKVVEEVTSEPPQFFTTT